MLDETGSNRQLFDQKYIGSILKEGFIIGMSLGFIIGFVGFLLRYNDFWFGIAIVLSIAAATIVSKACNLLLTWMTQKLSPSQSRLVWAEQVLMGCQDFVCCLTILEMTHLLSTVWLMNGGDDDIG